MPSIKTIFAAALAATAMVFTPLAAVADRTANQGWVKEQIGSATNALDAKISHGGSWPLFVIEMNPGESRTWQHFELKATTNNYFAASAENMIYFTSSTVNEREMGLPFTNDWCRLYMCSKRTAAGGTGDTRKWARIRNTFELDGYAPLALAVLVDPTMLKRNQGSSWLYEGNGELSWSYVRIGTDGVETDQDGRRCWRPAVPSKWYDSLPDWADQDFSTLDDSPPEPYVAPYVSYVNELDTSYRRFYTITNVNQSVQYVVDAPNGILEIKKPYGSPMTMDWVVYAFLGQDATLKLPSGKWWVADPSYTNSVPANRPTAFYFSQVTNDVFTMSRQEMTAIEVRQ